jgi:hypothetical protein
VAEDGYFKMPRRGMLGKRHIDKEAQRMQDVRKQRAVGAHHHSDCCCAEIQKGFLHWMGFEPSTLV